MLLTSKEFVGGGGAVNLVLVNMWQHIKFNLCIYILKREYILLFWNDYNKLWYVTLQLCVCLCWRKYKLWHLNLFLFIQSKSTEIFIFSSLPLLKKIILVPSADVRLGRFYSVQPSGLVPTEEMVAMTRSTRGARRCPTEWREQRLLLEVGAYLHCKKDNRFFRPQPGCS